MIETVKINKRFEIPNMFSYFVLCFQFVRFDKTSFEECYWWHRNRFLKAFRTIKRENCSPLLFGLNFVTQKISLSMWNPLLFKHCCFHYKWEKTYLYTYILLNLLRSRNSLFTCTGFSRNEAVARIIFIWYKLHARVC